MYKWIGNDFSQKNKIRYKTKFFGLKFHFRLNQVTLSCCSTFFDKIFLITPELKRLSSSGLRKFIYQKKKIKVAVNMKMIVDFKYLLFFLKKHEYGT